MEAEYDGRTHSNTRLVSQSTRSGFSRRHFKDIAYRVIAHILKLFIKN